MRFARAVFPNLFPSKVIVHISRNLCVWKRLQASTSWRGALL